MTKWRRQNEGEMWRLGYAYRDYYSERRFIWVPLRRAPNYPSTDRNMEYASYDPTYGTWMRLPTPAYWTGGPKWEERELTETERLAAVKFVLTDINRQ